MANLDVEALLESTANGGPANGKDSNLKENGDHADADKSSHHDKGRERDRKRRDRSADRSRKGSRERRRDHDGDEEMKSPRGSANGDSRRRRSRSRDSGRRSGGGSGRYREEHGASGDFYRGGGRTRSRSRSPHDGRYYRPRGRGGDNDDDGGRPPRRERSPRGGRGGGGGGGRRRTPSPRRKSTTPQPTEDERDRRTVFVQQLAARLRTKELIRFFEKVGAVKEAQIVKDRVSGRSKGVGYVEFKSEESVQPAIQLTGQKLLGIPIIAQLTEAEKNRQARNPDGGNSNPNSIPFHRLYVGNIHFSITESDLQNIFEPFGELEFVQLQKEDQGRSRGYGFVQFRDSAQAKEALEKMNGFELAGRQIRVGLGNDKFTPESTANMLQRFPNAENQRNYQGSAFSGSGGRGAHAGGSGGSFDRAGGGGGGGGGGGRDEKAQGGASALDDTDVAGVNFSNYSRDALMRKLARTDEPADTGSAAADERRKAPRTKVETKPLPVNVSQASRCVLLRNMFNPAEEEGDAWQKELEDDVKTECEDKYGHVVHISLDPHTQGDIYLKFSTVQGGENAIKGLNGRFFGGRQISAQPIVDAVYSSLFQRARAL